MTSTAARSRFDFAFIPAGPIGETIQFVQLGERLGYRCAWLPDQTFHRDPFVLLGLCASATHEIGLGLGVTSPFTRLPVQIARAAAAVDEVAGGRFRLGLGTANPNSVLAPLGIPLEKPSRRLRDALMIIRHLLAGERVVYEGISDTLHGVKLDFPVLHPNLPLYLGTRGPKTLELAGELADGVLAESLFNAEGMSYVMDHLHKGKLRSDSPRDVDIVAWQLVDVTDNIRESITAQKAWATYSINVGPPDAMRRIGIDNSVIEGVSACLARGDNEAAIAHVTDAAVRCLMIIGTPDDVSERIGEVFRRGATTISLLLMGSTDKKRQVLERFARDVMPAFR